MVSARQGQYYQHFKESCSPLETAQFREMSAIINISNNNHESLKYSHTLLLSLLIGKEN
jgi:hypothetical protein